MSEQNQVDLEAEMTLLKQQADLMGVPYKSNTRADTLRQKINDRLATSDEDDDEELDADDEANDDDESEVQARPVIVAPKKDTRSKEQKIRDAVRAEALPLLRCRIHNLNPGKNDLDGEIITVANRYVGTIAKFIPFGEATDNGYHIPKIIYDDLRGRKFQQVMVKKDNRGNEVVTRRMVPEYNIEVMPALTSVELKELALRQSAAERLGA